MNRLQGHTFLFHYKQSLPVNRSTNMPHIFCLAIPPEFHKFLFLFRCSRLSANKKKLHTSVQILRGSLSIHRGQYICIPKNYPCLLRNTCLSIFFLFHWPGKK